MGSTLLLHERLHADGKRRTRELTSWSKTEPGHSVFDRTALRFYAKPPLGKGSSPINLMTGFDESGFDPLKTLSSYMDFLLNAVMRVERESGKRLETSIVTQRGVLVQILALSQGEQGRYLLDDEFEAWAVGFDGQVFLCHCPPSLLENQESANELRTSMAKYMYAGFNFEYMATLPRPIEECASCDLEKRYANVPPMTERKDYNVLVETGINNVGVVMAAEMDCIESGPEEYVELKTTHVSALSKPFAFEWKLLKAWIQCYLVDCKKVVYGFRDAQFKLVRVREYRTAAIPNNPPCKNWDGDDVIKFYAKVAQWLKSEVKEGQAYRLVHKKQSKCLQLLRARLKVEGREIAFLPDAFVDWRRSLRSAPTQTEAVLLMNMYDAWQ